METYGIPVDHFSLSSLGVNLASSPHIINSRQVRKYSPLCSPQSLGSIISNILHIHDLQTGQKILHPQPQSLGSINSNILHIHNLHTGQRIFTLSLSPL
jgi:Ni/Fe-hydrogenase subunit HybB-like protein